MSFDTTADNMGTIKCKNCGANLKFKPGTESLSCDYCQTINEIALERTEVIENDFNLFIEEAEAKTEHQVISTVKCGSCGANTTLQPNVTSSNCPYCDTPLVVKDAATCDIIKPSYVLPFKVERNKAKEGFVKWVGGLWFAPSKLKNYAENSAEKLKGVYLPYWTYDSNTESDYSGLRGDHYYVTESYTDSNGRSQTRSVQKTRWSAASGHVSNSFDDVLVCASHSLPEKLVNELEPWDLPELVKYNDNFLAGFITESYQTGLKDGFGKAKVRMEDRIRSSVRSDIGGDTQQITTLSTEYNDITFKHILLPLWISAYRYNNKVYRFTINARTGEVQGERPYSAIKIALLVIAIIGIIVGIVYWNKHR
ncbi:MAG: zinc finger domain-containing protein [Bacteroidota bacterium]|jgi:LSD1 subclass zinc finger protein